MRILGGQHIRGIQYQEADIRPVNRLQSPHHTVCLYAAVYPPPPPNSCRIDQQCAPSVPLHYGIDGVASGARQLTDDGSLLPHQRIQEHRLPHIGVAEDRYPHDVRLRRRSRRGGKVGSYPLHERLNACAVVGADGNWLIQRHLVKLKCLPGALIVIAFVDRQNHWFIRSPERLSYLLIGYSHTVLDIYQHDDGVGFLDGDFNLLLDLLADGRTGAEFQPAGINEGKILIQPGDSGIGPVASSPRDILGDSPPLTNKAIEQGRFPHIGSAYDGNDVLGQSPPPSAYSITLSYQLSAFSPTLLQKSWVLTADRR
ncbi:MAG: hypothetical protein DDT25_00799 [Chloroflexi bacterium]|nr:hypothetical protein [Chloroflexota bacterium]